MNKYHQLPSVAIVTSTIGRQELVRTIESVKNQNYPCKHYIFVDGEQFQHKVEELTKSYSDLIITYLPMNTGANGWVNSSINAIAPYLIKEDIICYLDDDNWYEPNHIESIIQTFQEHPDADFIYSMRNFFHVNNSFICEDNMESLGFWENKMIEPHTMFLHINNQSYSIKSKLNTNYHIDTNCYAFKNNIAQILAPTWFTGILNDRNIFAKIVEVGLKGVSTKKYTLNYTVDVSKFFNLKSLFQSIGEEYREDTYNEEIRMFREMNQENIRRYNNRTPWIE